MQITFGKATGMPSSRAVDLSDVAHLPYLEGDEKTLSEIAAFVDGTVAGI